MKYKFNIVWLEIIQKAYDDFFEQVKFDIDEFGRINKSTISKLFNIIQEDIDDDIWIMDLVGWDYSIHFGKELFRPTELRGKITHINVTKDLIDGKTIINGELNYRQNVVVEDSIAEKIIVKQRYKLADYPKPNIRQNGDGDDD